MPTLPSSMIPSETDANSVSSSGWSVSIQRRFAVLAIAFGLVMASGCSSLAQMERSVVFQPARYPDGNWRPADAMFEDASFTSSDGTQLHGWYFPCENRRATILYCHGNGGNVAYWASAARQIRDRVGSSVLVFDYRGYGRSEGQPTETGILDDARAARLWLARREGIPERQIVLLGRSLGGGVAVDLAATDGARALILESTFTSIPDVAQTMFPLLPMRWLMETRFDSKAKIENYHGPLLQSHGTDDRTIPYAIGRRLFDSANAPKQFLPIPGGDHNDPPREAYYRVLSAFLDTI